MTAYRRLAIAFVVAGAIGALLIGATASMTDPPGAATTPGNPSPILILAWAALGGWLLCLGVLWLVMVHKYLRPVEALATETRFLAEAGPAHSIESQHYAWLRPLPDSVNALLKQWLATRQETEESVTAATRRIEEQKRWLEAILRDLSEGVLVCNMEHRVLLYNQSALSLLHVAGDLGLGRSLFNLITREPVLHAIEQLQLRDAAPGSDATASLVCATVDSQALLRGRLSLILDAQSQPGGYVLTITDVTREVAELGRRDALLQTAAEGMRGSLANLRAAVETLATYPEIDAQRRRAFDQVILRESNTLSDRLDNLNREYRGLSASHWPMADTYSLDLLNCVIRRLRDAGGPTVTMIGLPLWLRGDSHALVVAIERLLCNLADASGATSFDIEALLGDKRVYIDVTWGGLAISTATLDAWLEEPLPGALGAPALREILQRHGSEIWSRMLDGGRALLRLPLPAPIRVQFAPPRERVMPARPEFYDFDLMRLAPADQSLGAKPLRSFTYVVFDTETTGLSPSGGDELVSIGAVRVVNGRILTGETFSRLINPGRAIPPESTRFHGITDRMVADSPPAQVVLPQFRTFAADAMLIAHNAAFDMKFLKLKEIECGVRFDSIVLDTMLISASLYQALDDHSLDAIAGRLGIDIAGRHSALGDALATAAVFVRLLDLLEARGINTLDGLIRASNMVLEIRARQAHF
ncbi:MAG: PAS domain-containing protein [Proteobacteria bacterium]|nr:PAS domain-containing protein [Pseudomonadota bacterium]